MSVCLKEISAKTGHTFAFSPRYGLLCGKDLEIGDCQVYYQMQHYSFFGRSIHIQLLARLKVEWKEMAGGGGGEGRYDRPSAVHAGHSWSKGYL